MSNPLVSVVMPVYNGEKYVVEAMESILAQTFTNYEFIVVDDGSTDSTPELLKPYVERGVIVHRQPKNLGLVEALNTGWQMANGEYIARMDADDMSLPNRLTLQVQYLEAHPQVGILGTSIEFIDANGKSIQRFTMEASAKVIDWEIFFACPLAHPTVMIRRSLLDQASGYQESMKNAEDYDLWARLSQLTLIANLPEVLLRYRTWTGSITAIHKTNDMENKSVKVCQTLVSNYLNQEISLQEAATLRRLNGAMAGAAPKSKQEVIKVASIFIQLYDRYTHQTELTSSESQAIATSAALKMMVLSKLAFKFEMLLGLRLLMKGIRLSPRSLFTAINTELKKMRAKG